MHQFKSWRWLRIFYNSILLQLIYLTLCRSGQAYGIIQQRPSSQIDCPGSCTSVLGCKSMGAKILGMCTDGKVCCNGGGLNIPMPAVGSCGSAMANKVSAFQSPNYPNYSSGNLICEFTLHLNPNTAGIRVDFLDLYLHSIPTNSESLYESPFPVCDSDFLMIRGFPGWSPDMRCGNLTGYSVLIERDKGQATLSALLIMASIQYRWSIKFTEIYYNEIEVLDYSLRKIGYSTDFQNNKKHWTWYGSNGMGVPNYSVGMSGFPSYSLGALPPSWSMHHPTGMGEAKENPGETELSNITRTNYSESPSLEAEMVQDGNEKNNPLSRIVGGKDAEPNSIPFQVSLQLATKKESNFCGQEKNMSYHFCGGSIIGERTILTASHCFLSPSRYSHPLLKVSDIKVVVGEQDFCNDNEVSSTREFSVDKIILHYNYITTDVINDIAVIYLTKPIWFDQNVHPIPLADEQTKVELLKPQISGWGSLGVEENSTYPSVLQQTSNLEIMKESDCQHFQREFLDYSVPFGKLSGKYKDAFDHGICTKPTDNVTEAGFGDSGGPLTGYNANGAPQLLGITSHMRPHKFPFTDTEFHLNYFTKVSAYRKWILMTMVA